MEFGLLMRRFAGSLVPGTLVVGIAVFVVAVQVMKICGGVSAVIMLMPFAIIV